MKRPGEPGRRFRRLKESVRTSATRCRAITAAGMLLPDEVLAFPPMPIVGMDFHMHAGRKGVVLMDVPAGVAAADDAGRRA